MLKRKMMKRLVYLLSIFIFISACESEQDTDAQPEIQTTAVDSIQTYSGNFISVGKAAVLKGDSFVFQVSMDSVATNLRDDIKNYDLNNQNIVPVQVKGKIRENTSGTGYSQVIEITEVKEVFAERKPE